MEHFEVVIESVFNRTEDGKTRLAFRGEARSGDWVGYKTFFADSSGGVIDGATGLAVADVPSWLRSLTREIAPLTLANLTNAVMDHLSNSLHIKIERSVATSDGASTTVTYTEITDDDADEGDDSPYERLFFHLANTAVTKLEDELGKEPIIVSVFDAEPTQEVDSHGLVHTLTPLPVATLECIPCEAGRVDVRDAPRRSAYSFVSDQP